MCGRYALFDTSISDFSFAHKLVSKNYNVTPTTIVPVIVDNNEVKLLCWTLRVPWSNSFTIINARSETVDSKNIFKNTRRCIFIANGYFEWLRKDEVKIPYYHTFEDRMMYFGGIFNDYGACIVTRESYPKEINVHHRQPVVLQYDEFSNWFSYNHDYSCEHSRKMLIYEVSGSVNLPKNNSPDNVLRVS